MLVGGVVVFARFWVLSGSLLMALLMFSCSDLSVEPGDVPNENVEEVWTED